MSIAASHCLSSKNAVVDEHVVVYVAVVFPKLSISYNTAAHVVNITYGLHEWVLVTAMKCTCVRYKNREYILTE